MKNQAIQIDLTGTLSMKEVSSLTGKSVVWIWKLIQTGVLKATATKVDKNSHYEIPVDGNLVALSKYIKFEATAERA